VQALCAMLAAESDNRMPQTSLIVIVDDDAPVRESTQGLMRSLGFPARSFADAAAFLSSDCLACTACLIADVHMPGMSGLDLYRHLVACGRAVPTILITGYPDDSVRAMAMQEGIVGYLAKPCREDDLLSCLRRALP
jgi:FixJ family two-component response regulator